MEDGAFFVDPGFRGVETNVGMVSVDSMVDSDSSSLSPLMPETARDESELELEMFETENG